MYNTTLFLKKFLAALSLLIWVSLVLLIGFHAVQKPKFKHKQHLANKFLLTDYCLSTESRHIRHLNFPELIAPFQDVPGGHDHFPSSSFLFPNPQRFQQGFSEK